MNVLWLAKAEARDYIQVITTKVGVLEMVIAAGGYHGGIIGAEMRWRD